MAAKGGKTPSKTEEALRPLQQLPPELLVHICTAAGLPLRDVLSLRGACRSGWTALDDHFMRQYAHRIFPLGFWRRAMLRPAGTSKPLPSWRREVIRIERFQERLEGMGCPRWGARDFYAWWDLVDRTRSVV